MKNKQGEVSLDDKSVCMIVDFNKIGNSKRVATAAIEVDADKTMLRVNKSLLDSPEFDAIKQHDGYTKRWLYTRSLPSLFKSGIFRIPNTLLVEVDEYLQERSKERAKLVKTFVASYPERVAEALHSLRVLGAASDYKSPEEAATEFSLTWRYIAFSVPDSLKAIRKGLFERENKKTEKLFIEANAEIQNMLRESMAGFVDSLVSKLSDKSDGKAKRIHQSKLDKMADFIATFDARNIVDDVQLKALVVKARDLMKGVDTDKLKDSDGVREKVKVGFEKIKKQLDGMIVDKPSRRFGSFE